MIFPLFFMIKFILKKPRFFFQNSFDFSTKKNEKNTRKKLEIFLYFFFIIEIYHKFHLIFIKTPQKTIKKHRFI